MEPIYYNDKDINTMNTVQLLHALQQTDTYSGMTQKQIINELGGKSVYILRPELSNIISLPIKPSGPLIPELGPLVSQHLDIYHARLINKASLKINQQRFQNMENIYKFVTSFNTNINEQKQQIMSLSNYELDHVNILVNKIDDILLMFKVGKSPLYYNKDFMFANYNILLRVGSIVTQLRMRQLKIINNNIDNYLYDYIISHFTENVYNNFNNFYNNKLMPNNYEEFKIYQTKMLLVADKETIDLLYYLIYKISQQQLKIKYSYTYNASGFMFFNDKIVIYEIN